MALDFGVLGPCGPPSVLRRRPPIRATGRVEPIHFWRRRPRIGRLPDNEIVLDDPNVSRHHAVIIDTGSSYVITDLHSANGVDVRNQRIAIPRDSVMATGSASAITSSPSRSADRFRVGAVTRH